MGDAVVVAGLAAFTPQLPTSGICSPGDETALPAIAMLMEILPAYVEAQVVLEVRDTDRQLAPARAGALASSR